MTQHRWLSATGGASALFERDSRTVVLIVIGKQLRDDLRPAYDQITAGLTAASLGNSVKPAITVCASRVVRSEPAGCSFRAVPGGFDSGGQFGLVSVRVTSGSGSETVA